MTAGINNFGGYYRTGSMFKRERWGPKKHLFKGSYQSIIVEGLILGFNLVRGIESKVIKAVISAEKAETFKLLMILLKTPTSLLSNSFINSGQCFENN